MPTAVSAWMNALTRRFSRISRTDLAVYLSILLLGALHFICYAHTADFFSDAMYPDLARSLLTKGTYEFNFLPQTTLPPGFPLILAVVGWWAGLSPAVMFHVIAACTTLGLIAAYQLLRRAASRWLAIPVCLLLGASPLLFMFDTQVVFSDMPFFWVSMLVLLLTLKVDRIGLHKSAIGWILLLTIVLASAVLIRSVGIALILGFGSWIGISLCLSPLVGLRRIQLFLLPIVLAVVSQMLWSHWAQQHQVSEWHLGGWPQPYFAQLQVKSGNDPELGSATWRDIPGRVTHNLFVRTVELGQLVTGRWISRFWPSPAITGMVIAIILGLASSFRGGGQLYDWYYLWYEVTFLIWPWDFELRFLLPIVPLACLYAWRGVMFISRWAAARPRQAGICFVICGPALMLSSAAFAFRIAPLPLSPRHVTMDILQPVASILFWAALTLVGIAFIRSKSAGDITHSPVSGRPQWPHPVLVPFHLRVAASLILAVFVGRGVFEQIRIGRDNLQFDLTKSLFYPEIEAAEWIKTHEPPGSVIMARKQDLVFHYSGHRVVWFPPISNPSTLMDGIRRHHIHLVVVAHHTHNYWLPPEDVCFQTLLRSYGQAFHLVHQGPADKVYELENEPLARSTGLRLDKSK